MPYAEILRRFVSRLDAQRDATHHALDPASYLQARAGHLQRRRHEFITSALHAQETRDRRVLRVLELGSGGGGLIAELADLFPASRFEGIDVDARGVAYAQAHNSRPNARYALGDIEKFSKVFSDIDFVCSIDVLHHLPDPAVSYRALRSVCRHGATWCAVEPNIWQPYVTLQIERMRRAQLEEDHFRPWHHEPLLCQAGFRTADKTYATIFPSFIAEVPQWAERLERTVERVPLIGGSVIYHLVAE